MVVKEIVEFEISNQYDLKVQRKKRHGFETTKKRKNYRETRIKTCL